MSNLKKITGGDLEDLWQVANDYLARVQGGYNKQINEMLKVTDGPDEETFGRCHSWWVLVAQQYERLLFDTSSSLATTTNTLNRAIEEYSHCDGTAASELNEAGRKLEKNLNGKEEFNPTPFPTDDYRMNYDFPDSWKDEHDD